MKPGRWRTGVLGALLGSAVLLPAANAAQEPAPGKYAPGSLVEKTTSISDPSMHYAIYIPSAYEPDGRWPVIVLMDPRGRALVAIERFRAAAERRGYILISSYETRSDVEYDPNTPALRAMVTDADTLFSIHRSRIYLAGMSGTARNAWFHARFLGGSIAGVISFGAGGAAGEQLAQERPFAFFGGAGTRDFNYDELRAFTTDLQSKSVAARFAAFEGGHQWGPPELCAQAVDWMEIQAMRSGLKPVEAGAVEEIYQDWLAYGVEVGTRIGGLESFFVYRDLAVGLEGLRDTTEPRDRARRAAEVPAVQAELIEANESAEEHRDYLRRLRGLLDAVRDGSRLADVEQVVGELGVAELRRIGAEQPVTPRALSALRKLEAVFVNTSFYETNAYLREDRTLQAMTMLQIAAAVKPDDPRVLFRMAGIHARNGFRQAAADTLERAEALAAVQLALLLEDPFYFEPRSGEALMVPR